MGVFQKDSLSWAAQTLLTLSTRDTKWLGGDRLCLALLLLPPCHPCAFVNHQMPNTLPPVWDSDIPGASLQGQAIWHTQIKERYRSAQAWQGANTRHAMQKGYRTRECRVAFEDATHTGAAGAQSPCGRWGTGSGGGCTAGLQRREVGKAGGRGEGARHCRTH